MIINKVYQTRPKIVHFNGKFKSKNKYPKFVYDKLLELQPSPEITIPENCGVVTIASRRLSHKILIDQFKRLNKNLFVLGTEIKNYRVKRSIHKVEELIKFLENSKLEKIMFLDAADVLVLDNIDCIFNDLNKDEILFGAEKHFWYKIKSNSPVKSYYDNKFSEPFKYLNAGCFVGYGEYLLNALNIVKNNFFGKRSDQSAWIHTLYHNQDINFNLDWRCEKFQNTVATTEDEIGII